MPGPGNSYEGSYISALGCVSWDGCASAVIESGLAPNGTDVFADAMGLYFPEAWRRFRSYVVRLRGYFVAPFTADFRFVVLGGNWERTYVYLSEDHMEANKRVVASKSGGHDWYQNVVVSEYSRLDEGRGYYFEVRHAHHHGTGGSIVLRLCIMPPAGVNVSLPSEIGGANYHWESAESGMHTARAYGDGYQGLTRGLFDLTCAPGYGAEPTLKNATAALEASAGWGGSHVVQPVPYSFFRTEYTPTAEEIATALNRTRNVVRYKESGVGSWGGTCTCPDGQVYTVGDLEGCSTLACYGGVSGVDEDGALICSHATGPGSAKTSVTCAPALPPLPPPLPPGMPPAPPALPPLPPSMTMWSAMHGPSGVAAFTDGATGGHCDTVGGARVFWGFRAAGGGAGDDSSGAPAGGAPDFGNGCTSGSAPMVGTPCAPGALPAKRYNLLLVRSGPAESAGRLGLDQRRWRFDSEDEASSLYQAAGLIEQPGFPEEGHTLLYEWERSPHLSDTMMQAVFPVQHHPWIMSVPPSPTMSMHIPANWKLDRKWLQVSNGYFVPPVSGEYMFSVYSRSDSHGDAYVAMSSSAEPNGAYMIAKSTGFHDQSMSRWLSLVATRLYYIEFWQDYLNDADWWGGGVASVAVRLATTDESGAPVEIPQDIKDAGRMEVGEAGCEEDEDSFCFTGGTGGTGISTNQDNWGWFDVSHREKGLDSMWKPNYLFDPIPSLFLRRSGSVAAFEKAHAGGRGALRKVWGWTAAECAASSVLDAAWEFPWAELASAPAPRLKNASLPPNISEVIREISTPRSPELHDLQCYAETITTFFRPKRTAKYAFKLWSHDNYFARLFFNPAGVDPAGAIDVASTREARFPVRKLQLEPPTPLSRALFAQQSAPAAVDAASLGSLSAVPVPHARAGQASSAAVVAWGQILGRGSRVE